MPLNFPNSPTANQIYTDSTTGSRYSWDATNGVWRWAPNNVSLVVQTLAPGTPSDGQLWFNSELGRLFIYYSDGDSSQWIEASPASGSVDVSLLQSYVNVASDLSILAFVQSNTAYAQANAAYTQSNNAYVAVNTATQFVVKNNETTLINTGYTTTSFNAGDNVAAYGTWTPNPANGNYQYANSNGSVTIAAPSQNCGIDILLTNGTAAGSITFSGFTVGAGAGTYANTSGYRHILTIRRINNISAYSWYALQ
jgi:hypothetical protein